MSKSKPVASLSNLIDSDMEADGGDETDILPDSNQENTQPAKKGKNERRALPRSRAVTTRSTRLQAAQTKTAPVVAKKKPLLRKRATKRTDDQSESNEEELGVTGGQAGQALEREQNGVSMDELVLKEQPKKRGRPAKKETQEPKEESAQPAKPTEIDGEFEYTPVAVRVPPKKAGVAAKQTTISGRPDLSAVQRSPKIIPETQLLSFDHETRYPEEDEDLEEELPQSALQQRRLPARPQQPFPSRKRAGSVSDTENPANRRRIGEVTKKLDTLDMKYKSLREFGIKEAEANFERLKAQSETQSNAAKDLIQSLKKELATQTNIAQESRSLQRQLATKDTALSKAQQNITELAASLSESQNEIKTLQAKLANSRSASVTVESVNARTPGSAMKKGQSRTIMMGSAEAAQAAQVALLKEDLYSDLTGLILRGVERGEDSDIYDCIQTGRNGTLHFKLAVANDTDAKVNYEDTTFLYTPRLDSNRDRDLLELLPDYLSEEIAFSRVNAAKFYGRVMETLTKRRAEDS